MMIRDAARESEVNGKIEGPPEPIPVEPTAGYESQRSNLLF